MQRTTGLWHQTDFLRLWGGQTILELGSRITRDRPADRFAHPARA